MSQEMPALILRALLGRLSSKVRFVFSDVLLQHFLEYFSISRLSFLKGGEVVEFIIVSGLDENEWGA